MIHGNRVVSVKSYLPIDHMAEGVGKVQPRDGQTFWGFPNGWIGDHSPPFIEIRDKDGNVTESVNALDCHFIEFNLEVKSA